jgi:TetR/AcrR family transcriptional repressor of nem operon
MPKPNVREKIVDAALDLFQTRGYNGSGVNDIVQTAGVPKGSFYNHFASKEALGLETIARYWQDADAESLRDVSVPPLVRIRQHFETLAERFGAGGYSRGCLLGNFGAEMAEANPNIRQALSQTLAAWTDALAQVLREARAEGLLPPDKDVDKFARFLIDAWEGCLIRGKVTKNRSAVDDFFDITFGCLLK